MLARTEFDHGTGPDMYTVSPVPVFVLDGSVVGDRDIAPIDVFGYLVISLFEVVESPCRFPLQVAIFWHCVLLIWSARADLPTDLITIPVVEV